MAGSMGNRLARLNPLKSSICKRASGWRESGQHYHLAEHAQIVVQSALVIECARMCEGDPESRDSEHRLRQTNGVLQRCRDKSGVHAVGSRVDNRV